MPSSPLTNVLPAKVRKYVYAAYAVAVALAGILSVCGVEVGDKTTAILTAIGGLLGATAASNVHKAPNAR